MVLPRATIPALHLLLIRRSIFGIWLAGDPDVVEISGGRMRSLATSATAYPRRRQGGRHPRRLRGFDRPAWPASVEGDDLQASRFTSARALSRNLTLPPIPAIRSRMHITTPPADAGGRRRGCRA